MRSLSAAGWDAHPFIGKSIRSFLPTEHILSYCEAILRVYNQLGRRDDKYKARIKVLVHETGEERFRELVEAEWEAIRDGSLGLPEEDVALIRARFTPYDYEAPVDFTTSAGNSP